MAFRLFVCLLASVFWLLTPAFAQLPSGTPAYAVNAKWVTDHGSQVYNVRAYGAVCDGVTDDTAALQNNVIPVFSQKLVQTGVSGTIFVPGPCVISSPLVLAGLTSAKVRIEGGAGAKFIWAGSTTNSMLICYGCQSGVVVENVDFDMGSGARFAIHAVADNAINTTLGTAVSAGSATVTPGDMSSIGVGTLLGIDNGTASAEVVYVTAATSTTFTATFTKAHAATATVGHGATTQKFQLLNSDIFVSVGSGLGLGDVLGSVGGTPHSSQTSEITVRNSSFTGVTNPTSGIVTLDGNNVGNTWVYNSRFFTFPIALDFGNNSFVTTVDSCNFEYDTTADIQVGSIGTLIVRGSYSELAYGTQFITSIGGGVQNLLVEGNDVGLNAAPATYVVAASAGITTLRNNKFHGSGTAKISVAGMLFNSYGVLISENNFFEGAATWAPFYDTNDNFLLPSYYANQPVSVTSINDKGGTYPGSTKLQNYLATAVLVSQTCASPWAATVGVLRACDTDTAVAFPLHAGGGNVNGLSKGTNDVVQVGGAAGISTAGPAQIGGHLGSTSGDVQGYLSSSSSTTATKTFATAFTSTPVCVVTPIGFDPTTNGFEISAITTTGFTVTFHTSGSWQVSYICHGNPN